MRAFQSKCLIRGVWSCHCSCAVPRWLRFPFLRSPQLRQWPNRRMAVDEVVRLLLRRGLLPRCRMPRRRCPAFRRHPGWPRRPRIWRLRPRPRAWRLLISPRPARLRRWHHAWRRRMSQRRRGKWRCRMVGRASPKAVLHLIVPLLTLRAAGPSADDLRPARKGMAGTRMQRRASSTAMPASAISIGMPPDRRTLPKIVTRWRAPGNSLAATPPSGGALLPKPVTRRSAAFRREPMKDAPRKAGWSNAARRSSEIRSSPISAWRAGTGERRRRQ